PDLAEHVVGAWHDDNVEDRRVQNQDQLDLDQIDIVPTTNEHLLQPPGQPQQPPLVDANEVTDVDPTIPQRRRRHLGIVPIATHHTRQPQAELAHRAIGHRPALLVADLDLHVTPRAP